MAAYQTSRVAPKGVLSTLVAGAGLQSLLGAFLAWNDARVTRKALGRLSDRELDDIGLCRGDVEMLGR